MRLPAPHQDSNDNQMSMAANVRAPARRGGSAAAEAPLP